MARMMPSSRDYVLSKYNLKMIKSIEDFVAEEVEVSLDLCYCSFPI
jgi:homocitrate synthase